MSKGKERPKVEGRDNFRATGRLVGESLFGPHEKNHILNPVELCRGAFNYPNATNEARFKLQFQYLMLNVVPILNQLDDFARSCPQDMWDLVKDTKSGEVSAALRIERSLREAWKGRPKSR